MRGKLDTHLLDRQIAALAARQYGVITRAQLVALGLGEDAIDYRLSTGRLHRVHRGVYAVGHRRLTRHALYLAAVLTCGKGAVLSHSSAARLWRLPCREESTVHVTVSGTGGRLNRPGLAIHRAALGDRDLARVEGIPVTSPGRTLVDLADIVPRRALERALDEAAYLRLDLSDLSPTDGRRGSGLLAEVLARHKPGTTLTRSQLEERFLGLCRSAGLRAPEVNRRVRGYEVDFVWRPRRLVVETDGSAAHGTRAAFERDRARDAALTAAGWRVVRITHRRLTAEPEEVAALLRTLLGAS
jgi:very-short-patch-repair endonuclease